MSIFDSLKKISTNSTPTKNTVKENNTREFDLNIEKILENWEVYHNSKCS